MMNENVSIFLIYLCHRCHVTRETQNSLKSKSYDKKKLKKKFYSLDQSSLWNRHTSESDT